MAVKNGGGLLSKHKGLLGKVRNPLGPPRPDIRGYLGVTFHISNTFHSFLSPQVLVDLTHEESNKSLTQW